MTAPAADLDNLGNVLPLAGDEGDAMPNPEPASCVAGEDGAEPAAAPDPMPVDRLDEGIVANLTRVKKWEMAFVEFLQVTKAASYYD